MITSVGLDPAKVREGLESLDLRGPDGRPVSPSARPIFRVLHGEPYRNEELRIAAGPGAGRVFSVSGTAVRDAAGEVVLAVNTFREVTGQKADEAERERLLAEVGRRAAQLEQFISIVSHDLRTPMTTVQANAHMIRRAPEDPEHVARRAESILTATRRMDRMIRDLVEATRLEAGQISLETEPLDLASFALELKERLVGTVDTGRVVIELPDAASPAQADPDRLERIFTNLLTNALKYSEKEVVVRFGVGDEEVEVSVCDRGPGIEPAELPRLFEWGYRSRRAQAAEGLGLGLYITRMLVEAHGGRIWAESEPGKGSTFRFTLPRLR
jgi:signal transduction histidine kinase